MKRTTLLSLAFALLTGCVSSGMKHAELKASLPALKSDEGRVYFYRNSSFVGAAVQPDIQLSGVTVGTSKPGGFFVVDRPAGKYQASASTEVERSLSFTLGGGETKYVRTSPSFGVLVGRINFELVNAPEAESELDSLHLTGAPSAPQPSAAEPAKPAAAVPRA
jgi:hypothetical protein